MSQGVGEIFCLPKTAWPPTFLLSMDCFWAEIISGEIVLKEAEKAKWLAKETIDSVNWLPADVTLVNKLKEYLSDSKGKYE